MNPEKYRKDNFTTSPIDHIENRISKEVNEKGFFTLPKGTEFKIKLEPAERSHDPENPCSPKEDDLGTYKSERDIMLGGDFSYRKDPISSLGLILTSEGIIKARSNFETWENELLDDNIPLEYYEGDPDIDMESFIADNPELEETRNAMLTQISSLQKELDTKFLDEFKIEPGKDFKAIYVEIEMD